MDQLLKQMIQPLLASFESCATTMTEDIPIMMKLEILISRTVYALNRPDQAANSRGV